MEVSLTEFLSPLSPFDPLGGALVGIAAGILLGLIHFGSLWWNVRLLASGGALRALAIQVLRFALLTAALLGLAKLGAAALLAGGLGLLLARGLLLRRLGPGRLGGPA
jgi:F1F0 ATPase subunit 2